MRQTAHQPACGLHESDGRRSLRPQMSHHRRIDEKHHGGGDLCQNAGDTQLSDQCQLLTTRHRAPFPYIGE